jgi:hypothetical protein
MAFTQGGRPRIVREHRVIKCEDSIEAKALKEDLEVRGATVKLRESPPARPAAVIGTLVRQPAREREGRTRRADELQRARPAEAFLS